MVSWKPARYSSLLGLIGCLLGVASPRHLPAKNPPHTVFLHLPAQPTWPSAKSALLNDVCLRCAVLRATERLVVWVDNGDAVVNGYGESNSFDADWRSIVRQCTSTSEIYSTALDIAMTTRKSDLDIVVLHSGVFGRGRGRIPLPDLVLGVDRSSAIEAACFVGNRIDKFSHEELPFESIEPTVAELTLNLSGSPKYPVIFLDDFDTTAAPVASRLKRIAVGGTFDRLHVGHKKLLSAAAAITSESVIVGITTPELTLHKSDAKSIQSFETRVSFVKAFLGNVRPGLQVDVMGLADDASPAVSDPSLDGLVVSSETLGAARAINEERGRRGFEPLTVFVVRRTQQAVLSSTLRRHHDHNQ
mmetsp:Transcript_34084/g.69699  ORF Transcript_34084/g.69699 Transcript_34084/m.69699 type:complete len:360 (-) Transcript_34084:53-1132(-)